MSKTFLFSTATMLPVLFLLSGCTHDLHESIGGDDADSGTDTGYLAMELAWEEPSDSQNSIDFVQLRQTDADGIVHVHSFDFPQEVASQYNSLPAGPCSLFATINITEDNGYRLTGIDTRVRADNADDIRLSLIDPATPPVRQVWYGFGEGTIVAGRLNVVRLPMQRAESSITVRITDAPAGTTASVEVRRVADYISLNVKDDNGRPGVPGEAFSTVSLGSLSEEKGDDATTLGTTDRYLFPTAAGFTRSCLDIHITTPSGNTLHSVADTPAMIMGRHYTVDIDYKRLSPYVYLDSCVISDWEEGWTIGGSVLNPD